MTYGSKMAKIIKRRMDDLKAAEKLEDIPVHPPHRRHQLLGNRDEQFAVDLIHPYRLIFEVNNDPIPRKEDHGIDLNKVTAIKILEVEDYHGKK
jgi:proteic killer suppression protein